MRPQRLIIAWAISLLLVTVPAQAHKVTVFAWLEGQTVYTESKFSGGKKVNGGKIEVYDHLNRKVEDGITDDRGEFAFPLPDDAKTLKVVLTAGMGHTNHWQITSEELGRGGDDPPVRKTTPVSAAEDPALPDAGVLETIVERAVEKKLAPIRAQLAQQAWGLRDIVAGIGYILGLMGLASYLHYRKRPAGSNGRADRGVKPG